MIGNCVRSGRAVGRSAAACVPKEPVLFDIVYVLGVIVVFLAIGLLGRAVEKL